MSAAALASHDLILLPNFLLPKLPDASADLVVNTGSLSEMEPETVGEYIGQVGRTLKGYFLNSNSAEARVQPFGHVEVPTSRFPVGPSGLRRLFRAKSPWQRGETRYVDELYVRERGTA